MKQEDDIKILKCRWVVSHLHIPKVCGNRFRYTIDSFGVFSNDKIENDVQAENALAVFLKAVICGLELAIQARDEILAHEDESTGKMTAHNPDGGPVAPAPSSGRYLIDPVPSSGRQFQVGIQKIDLEFCASPITGAAKIIFKQAEKKNLKCIMCRASNEGRCDISESEHEMDQISFSISQGDLFHGSLCVECIDYAIEYSGVKHLNFQTGTKTKDDAAIWGGERGIVTKAGPVVGVLAKVTSTAVHHCLVDPENVYTALSELLGIQEVRSVIYGVVEMENGLVTIMANLSLDGYKPLVPKTYENCLGALWSGLIDLFNNVLIPAAKEGVIFVDIRPGWDKTSNILVKLDKTGRAIMKLIDFEGFTFCKSWTKSSTSDFRYIPDEYYNQNKFRFLWWQCIFLAFVWKGKKTAKSVQIGAGKAHLLDPLYEGFAANEMKEEPSSRVQHYFKHNDIEQNLTLTLEEIFNYFQKNH